jgi:hemoglobin
MRATVAIAMLTVLLTLAGCAGAPAKPATDQTLYERLGGKPAIDAVVADALNNIAADTRINWRFAHADLARLNKNLADLLCLRAGGPCVYTGQNMAAAHDGTFIRDEEFDALVQDLVKSLDKFKVPSREKGELLAMLGQMRNSVVGH